eukprot:CAMPEP_0203866740 /NCGR_PEP_ID=MMETSP0359-20131031/16121_1 /ASSEMBLY_ACC=CAM_ASM_000338 /TAXON_ID=268821 /ORGANISM="Scrippsiella Hangoei, Strain SHTV-5" /LENGTH=175 /DNA_ID=CAMNT_0050784879 /DNA_START=359 /DNA_END=886 /DNA_ORIENTATION=-
MDLTQDGAGSPGIISVLEVTEKLRGASWVASIPLSYSSGPSCGTDAESFLAVFLGRPCMLKTGCRCLTVSASYEYFGPGMEFTHDGTESPMTILGFCRIDQAGLFSFTRSASYTYLGPGICFVQRGSVPPTTISDLLAMCHFGALFLTASMLSEVAVAMSQPSAMRLPRQTGWRR